MDNDTFTTLVILGIGIVVMATELLRADLAASLLAVTMALVIFILTHGPYRTGVTHRVGRAPRRLTGAGPTLLRLVTMLSGAVLSLLTQNIAAAVESIQKLDRNVVRLLQQVGVRACTDVTGFALLGHAHEMAERSDVRFHLHFDRLPLLEGGSP